MQLRSGLGGCIFVSVCVLSAHPADGNSQAPQVPLVVPAGAPLRLYLTRRVPKRSGAPVEAKVLEPVYAFDREVIPAGAVVLGKVTTVRPVSGGDRARAILGGDFTPLHTAPVEFNTLIMPDGRRIPLHTTANLGLDSIVPAHPPRTSSNPSTQPAQNTGIIGTGKQKVSDAVHAQIDRARSIPDIVRGPDKMERVEDYLVTKLPYHPQWVRKGTRFDADLLDPLDFGSAPFVSGSLAPEGTQPSADSVGHARLITPLDSASSKAGEKVEAVLAQPIFSADHKLILPEGTRLEGSVVEARRARRLRRSGQLRFVFKSMELPEEMAKLEAAQVPAAVAADTRRTTPPVLKYRTQADLKAAESSGKAQLKVDGEGGVHVAESKTRFLAAAAAVMIARRSGDLDPIRNRSGQVVGQSQNVGGRTIGGGFGFGLLGTGIAQSSRVVGAAFGYYGMAWALYSTLIARGSEVQFGKDAVIDIKFTARPDETKTGAKTKSRE